MDSILSEKAREHAALALRGPAGAFRTKALWRQLLLPRLLILGLRREVFEIGRDGLGADAPLQGRQHFDRPRDWAEVSVDHVAGPQGTRGFDGLAIDPHVAGTASPCRERPGLEQAD